MTPEDIKKLARQKLIQKHPEMAATFVMEDLKEEMSKQKTSAIVEMKGAAMIKGDKGDTGEKGDPGDAGPKGDTGPIGLTGKDGPQGPEGATGMNGIDGLDGKDGSNADLTGLEIKNRLESLSEDLRLDISAIKGGLTLDDIKGKLDISDIKNGLWNQPAKGKLDQRWHGSGLTQVYHDATLTGDGTASSPLSVVDAGDGDVSGPSSSIDSDIAVFDGTTGKLIKDGGLPISTLQLWDRLAGTSSGFVLQPHTNTDRTLLGGAVDDGSSTLQVKGNVVLGSSGSNIITNGTFASNSTGWTLGTGWTWSAGLVTKTTGNTNTLSQPVANMSAPFVIGQYYQLQFTLARTAGSISASAAGGTTFTVSTSNTYQFVFKALNTVTPLTFLPTGTAFAGSISNVSIVPLYSSLETISDVGSFSTFNSSAGLKVYDQFNEKGLWTSAGSIDGYNGDLVGNFSTWGDIYLNKYSTGNISLAYGGGSVVVGLGDPADTNYLMQLAGDPTTQTFLMIGKRNLDSTATDLTGANLILTNTASTSSSDPGGFYGFEGNIYDNRTITGIANFASQETAGLALTTNTDFTFNSTGDFDYTSWGGYILLYENYILTSAAARPYISPTALEVGYSNSATYNQDVTIQGAGLAIYYDASGVQNPNYIGAGSTHSGLSISVYGDSGGNSITAGIFIISAYSAGTTYGILDQSDAPWWLANDNQKLYFGSHVPAASISYAGDFVINPKETGSGNLDVQGSLIADNYSQNITQTAVTPYTVLPSDSFIEAQKTTAQTITLPAANAHILGQVYTIKKTAATGTITINVAGSGTIDGGASVTLVTLNGCYVFITDGAEWKIISKYLT